MLSALFTPQALPAITTALSPRRPFAFNQTQSNHHSAGNYLIRQTGRITSSAKVERIRSSSRTQESRANPREGLKPEWGETNSLTVWLDAQHESPARRDTPHTTNESYLAKTTA
jgi:hypothetical protein